MFFIVDFEIIYFLLFLMFGDMDRSIISFLLRFLGVGIVYVLVEVLVFKNFLEMFLYDFGFVRICLLDLVVKIVGFVLIIRGLGNIKIDGFWLYDLEL